MKKKITENNTNNKGLFLITIISLVFVIGLWTLNYFFLKDQNNESKAAFGNMFGPISALFSGLAFVGVIVTIILQSRELALQRLELKDTREELKRSADAQEKSERALLRQAENLKISAKLTALNTLVTYNTESLKTMNYEFSSERRKFDEVERKRDSYVRRIEEILNSKDSY
jgi:hypothetical protein